MPIVESAFTSLIYSADTKAHTYLLAAHEKESGAWLSTAPASAIALRMDDKSIKVATGL